MRKLSRMSEALDDPTTFPEEDECMVVCFGSTYGAAREAVDILRQDKVRVGMLHFAELCPFPRERALARLSKARKVISVEMNSTGQLATLLARETRIKVSERVLKYDGRPFVGAGVGGRVERHLQMTNDQFLMTNERGNDQGGSRIVAFGHWAFVGNWQLGIGHSRRRRRDD